MRQKRAKTYKKLMGLYSKVHGFRQPYQVLVDASFCSYATQNKIDIRKQLDTVLQGQAKPMITQCSMVELYKLWSTHQLTVDIAKDFERRKCNHREAIENDECLKSVVGDTNKHRYIIASQSQELRKTLRSIPFVPLIHINRVVTILEPPSDATLRAKALGEVSAQEPSNPEKIALAASQPVQEEKPKKRKGPKGPNPLSVKKKQKKDLPQKQPQKPSKSQARDTDAESQQSHSVERSQEGTKGSKGKKRMREGEEDEEMRDGASAVTAVRLPQTLSHPENSEAKTHIVERDGLDGDVEARGRKKKRRRKAKTLDDAAAGTDEAKD